MTIILKELKKYASAKRRTSNEWFFKTGKGQYGATLRYAIERMEEGKRKKFLMMKSDKLICKIIEKIWEKIVKS